VTPEKLAILAAIRSTPGLKDREEAERFLCEDETRLSSNHRVFSGSRDALGTWSSRLKNAERRQLQFPGLMNLVAKLRELPSGTRLEQLNFTGRKVVGIFFILRESGSMIGFVLGGEQIIARKGRDN
jgi:hypothetical protein